MGVKTVAVVVIDGGGFTVKDDYQPLQEEEEEEPGKGLRRRSFLSLVPGLQHSKSISLFFYLCFPSPIVKPPLVPPLSHVPARYNDRTKFGFVAGCIAPG